jgi:hypothetical protein
MSIARDGRPYFDMVVGAVRFLPDMADPAPPPAFR